MDPKPQPQLLESIGDLETLLARADEIKQQKRRENLIEFADLARISKRLVTLETHVPLEVPLDALSLEPTDGPRLVAFLKSMEFNTLTRKVAEVTDTDAATVEPANIPSEMWNDMRGPDSEGVSGNAPAGKSPAEKTPGEGSAPVVMELADDATFGRRQLADSRKHQFHRRRLTRPAMKPFVIWQPWTAGLLWPRETGLVAFDTETTSLDPMQAELVGFSLAIADNSKDPSGPISKPAIFRSTTRMV